MFNLGDRPADFRGLFRQLVAGVEPGREVVIGRSREPRRGILIQDAWLEVNDFDVATEDFHQMKYSLALSNTRPPTVAALLLPVGRVSQSSDGTTNPDAPLSVEQLFNAQGTLWACQWIGVDVQESGAVVLADVDVHLDWSGAFLDWWDWFVRWNQLEEFPDGSLTDGERQYA